MKETDGSPCRSALASATWVAEPTISWTKVVALIPEARRPGRSAICCPIGLRSLPLPQDRCQLAFEKIDELSLVGTDLDQDDVVVASLDVAVDCFEMPLW
jgi:hypothetical protein